MLYSCLYFYLQWNSLYLSFYSLTSAGVIFFNHHSVLQLSWLLNIFSRGNLLACCNSSKILFILFFIMYLQYFLIWRAYDFVYPHHWALPLFTMENMRLSKTLTQWEGSARKDDTGVYSSIFSLGDFRTLPWATIDGCFITSCIVLSSSLTMASIIRQRWRNVSSTIFIIASDSILLETPLKFFGKSCSSAYYTLLSAESQFWKAFE